MFIIIAVYSLLHLDYRITAFLGGVRAANWLVSGAILDPGSYLTGRFDAGDRKSNNGYCGL